MSRDALTPGPTPGGRRARGAQQHGEALHRLACGAWTVRVYQATAPAIGSSVRVERVGGGARAETVRAVLLEGTDPERGPWHLVSVRMGEREEQRKNRKPLPRTRGTPFNRATEGR